MGYELRGDAEWGGVSGQWQTHTYIVSSDTQVAWSLEQCSDAILTHVSVAPPLFTLMGYEHQEDAVGGGGSRQ